MRGDVRHLAVGALGVDVPPVRAVADEAQGVAGPQGLHHALPGPTRHLPYPKITNCYTQSSTRGDLAEEFRMIRSKSS